MQLPFHFFWGEKLEKKLLQLLLSSSSSLTLLLRFCALLTKSTAVGTNIEYTRLLLLLSKV